jgi:hypothetical protein
MHREKEMVSFIEQWKSPIVQLRTVRTVRTIGTVAAAVLTCLFSSDVSADGKVTGSGGPTPHPAICFDASCVYQGPADYAQNEVRRKMSLDADFLSALVREAEKRNTSGLRWPAASDTNWWLADIQVDDVSQTVDLGPPQLISNVPGIVTTIPLTYPNCGPVQNTIKRSTIDRKKVESTASTEQSTTNKSTKEDYVQVGASYGQVLTASASEKVTTTVEQFRREVMTKHEELEQTLNVAEDIVLPPNSITTRTVTERSFVETYKVEGTVTTDARLWITAAINEVLGRWSDFVRDPKARQLPVSATIVVQIREFELPHDSHVYASEKECRAAQASLH